MSDKHSYHYRLDVAYNGQGFHGFQSQPHGHTIQDHLEKALATFLPFAPRVVGASRTDTDVSAKEQVCGFQSPMLLDVADVVYRLNALLPAKIRAYRCEKVDKGFHPIASSTGKIYRYSLWLGPCRDPFWLPWVWSVPENISLERFARELEALKGKHNFKSFARVDESSPKSYEREIYAAKLVVQKPVNVLWIHGDGFLRYMVRNIVGSLVALSSGTPAVKKQQALRKKGSSMLEILASLDRTQAYECAPAAPLMLMRCLYSPENSPENSSKASYDLQKLISDCEGFSGFVSSSPLKV